MARLVYLVLSLTLSFSLIPSAYPQSLADLAKKEKDRREKFKAGTKVITNGETDKYKDGPVTTGSPAPPRAETAAPPKTEASQPPEPVDFQGRPESFWRQTFADVRQQVKELENESNVLTLKLSGLQTQFYGESSGFKQQDIQREIQKSFYLQDQNKENLAKARDQLQELEKESRKSGALPGWRSPKAP